MKIKLFLISSFTTVLLSYSQNTSFGIKAGLNVSSLTGKLSSNKDWFIEELKHTPRIGFNVGIFTKYSFNQKYFIQGELIYSQQGLNSTRYPVTKSEKYIRRRKLDYLNIPILVGYTINDKFSFKMGPQIGILISGKENISYFLEGSNYGNTIDLIKGDPNYIARKPVVKEFDLSTNLGLDYKISDRLLVNGTYILGLTNISTQERYNNLFFKPTFKNSLFQLSVSYTLIP